MILEQLPKLKPNSDKPFAWARKMKVQKTKAKKFSVPEVKKALKLVQTAGLTAAAFEIAPDGTFRLELATQSEATENTLSENPWDKVL